MTEEEYNELMESIPEEYWATRKFFTGRFESINQYKALHPEALGSNPYDGRMEQGLGSTVDANISKGSSKTLTVDTEGLSKMATMVDEEAKKFQNMLTTNKSEMALDFEMKLREQYEAAQDKRK